MKTIYLIYARIPTLLFDNKLCNLVSRSNDYKLVKDYYVGLYAWTTSKLLMEAFFEAREGATKMYVLKKKKMDKEDFHGFLQMHFDEELLYYRIPSHNSYEDEFYSMGFKLDKNSKEDEIKSFFSKETGVMHIPCTRKEVSELYEYGEQYLHDYMCQIVRAEYGVLADKYKLALDALGYCGEFNLINGYDDNDNDDFYYARVETTEFNRSYNMTYYGSEYVDIYDNKIALFVLLYYEMIFGYTDADDIKLLIQN